MRACVCVCLCVRVYACVRVCACVCVCVYKRLKLPDCRSHGLQILPTPQNKKPAYRYLTVPRSKLYDPPKWWKCALSRFSWSKVRTGVKCNFSSAHHHVQKVVGKLSISQVPMCNFIRIGRTTKKLWLPIIPVQRSSEQPGLGPPQKGVNCNFSLPKINKPYGVQKVSISDA